MEGDHDPVLIFDFFLLCHQIVQQVQQTPGPIGCLFAGSLPLTHVSKVLVFLFQVLYSGSRDLQVLTGKFHLAIHPINTFPLTLYVGGIMDLGLIAGGILQYDIGMLDIRFPVFGQYFLVDTYIEFCG